MKTCSLILGKRKMSVLNFYLDEFRQLGISSRSGCLSSTDKDCRKSDSILAHCVNSVSGLALDFGYRFALDFCSYHMHLVN